MNIEKMTKLAPVTLGYVEDPGRPVLPFSMELRRATCHAEHAHPRGQLLYAGKGVMRVVCGAAIWAVPPTQAVWLPPGTPHIVHFPGEVSLRNVFVDAAASKGLPARCVALEVSPLLREMVFKCCAYGCEHKRNSPAWRLALALLDELREARPAKLSLPTGSDPRLQRLQDALLAKPSESRSLAELAPLAGASARTMARLFESETGLGFGAWRRRLRLMEAMERLASGASVAETACSLGYESSSAFIAMFRRECGASPGRLLLGKAAGGTTGGRRS
jgi:AraC-like DNA-binding protein